MKLALKILLLLMLCKGHEATGQTSMLLNKDFVDLNGKKTTTVFTNSTHDTLLLKYVFFNWLPYTETRDELRIPPGQKDSITSIFNFPDFIEINNTFKVYNSPGKRLICAIEEYKPSNLKMSFNGEMSDVNEYYEAYHGFLHGYGNESAAYYTVSQKLRDWNDFPLKADSITQSRFIFLDQYSGSLPAWFKKHEHRRLLYNQYCRLSNALGYKELASGKKIKVNESYFKSADSIITENDIILNDTYVYCMDNYFADRAKGMKMVGRNRQLTAIDSLWHQTDIGDINLMLILGRLYKSNKMMYNTLIQTLKFKDPDRKRGLDSSIQLRFKPSILKANSRKTVFTDIKEKKVSLTDYKGEIVVVNFWAVWCGPCKTEFPFENELYNKYKDKGLVVINICFDSDKLNWMHDSKKYNLQMINLFSEKHDSEYLLKEYNLASLPASILIDRNGNISDGNLERASVLLKQGGVPLLNLK